MTKKILLLTAGHLSSCPRLLKEAEALEKQGYSMTISFMQSVEYVKKIDAALMLQYPTFRYIFFDWNKKSFSAYLLKYASILQCKWNKFLNVFKSKSNQSAWALQNNTLVLWKSIQNEKADLIIAHHPACLFLANKLSKRTRVKFGYDIEDAFAYIKDGAFLNNPDPLIYQIEKKYLQSAVYLTAASPLYIDLYKKQYNLNQAIIRCLNVFEKGVVSESVPVYKDRKSSHSLSIYWVSQTVGLNRGLQFMLQAINCINRLDIELHIRGRCSDEVKSTLMDLITNQSMKENIFFHEQVDPMELKERSKEHDIGFVFEKITSLNRSYCIANKVFEYMTAGLVIFASNTPGHQYLLKEHSDFACIFEENSINALVEQIRFFADNRDELKSAKEKSLRVSIGKYNWDQEQVSFINKIKEVLS